MEKPKDNIMEKIRNYINSEDATITNKEIGNFILNSYENLPNMQLKEMKNEIEASQSSITRFLKDLGLNGYKELILKIEDIINSNSEDAGESEEYFNQGYEDSLSYKVDLLFKSFKGMDLNYNKLTPTEKKIFDYLDDNIFEITELTIKELADKINVAPGSIYNFIENKLFMNSYSELKQLLEKYSSYEENINKPDRYSYNKDSSLNDFEVINSLLKEINHNISNFIYLNDIKKETEKSDNENLFSKFNKVILNSSNILIFDRDNLTKHLLHDHFNDLGFLNFHVNSYDKAIKKIDLIKKNSDSKKESLAQSLKKHINQRKEIIDSDDISKNLMKHIAEKTVNERDLIIIMATDKYNKKINDIIDKSIKNNFSIILFEASHTSKAIGEYPEIDLRINIGDSFIVNENNTRETITLTIIMEILINQFKKSI
jgi:DNA-binding MurR/RpiR family transcriptional regulator